MRKNRKIDESGPRSAPQPAPALPGPGLPGPGLPGFGLALEKAEGGSNRSKWEILLQLRALLPYLSHLTPLLERTSKSSPELSQMARGMAAIQAGSREIETLTRNQTLQLERIEERLAHLQVAHQQVVEESRLFFAETRAFRRWVILVTVLICVLVGATAGMVAYLLSRT
jgi:hypothetical protein